MRGFFSFLLRTKPQRLHQRMQLFTSKVANKSYLYPNLHYFAHFSTTGSDETLKYTEKSSQLEIEIISEENIKPASPTQNHLKTYELSIIDQLFPHIYTPFIYFYPNNITTHHDANLISKRRQLLKQSLSETLTRFYPLAGKVKDSRHIDCNDDGVYYIDAKASNLLSDFLKKQPSKSINNLLPFDPNSTELLSKTYVTMIQVTVFDCGGIAIGLYASHKIIDAYSRATFLKAWAATARGCLENNIHPNFIISPSTFPSNPTVPADETMLVYPESSSRKNKTARFVFHASSITSLKKKTAASTRVMAVTGLIWKCAMMASLKTRSKDSNCDSIPRSSALTMTVNLRKRMSPPMPPYTIGNIIWGRPTIVADDDDDDLRLSSIVQRLKESVDFINNDFIEKMREYWSVKVGELLNEMKLFHSKENTDYILVTSICNVGIYDADFGWGRPIWVSAWRTNTNVIVLMDTRSRNGIEAWVTLREEEMTFLERDSELLAFASLNPSPLEIVDW